ncbi:uncharacterized protein SPPG_03976 [Spizellomyces punctatus DAOM BR117]|uniref:MORN repeat-containing protein 5 n=1 Tax=Spizellomyces punctatus (strain DAOM BR117) TaxID=645134 RepID=A0A0L0HJ65_SPIPD|nr:uncharacterized protein SPPG_03976 [Spizellomyces punctatus DAOM BR117]KND00874.1 hypothetical protein SPPG_03976 [Spizellomyces punctatus DAOM BR117]|eukprot:XP_016608913.1 hypothetical protein SPPG_03976 [Spizellomyces punctatus DAOM BR117]
MAFAGSPFEAEIVNDRIEGKGRYIFPDGNIYVGDFKDGQFHGSGTVHFKDGGKYEAQWKNGVALSGTYTFKDGLEYAPEDWSYCTEADRRFYSERINGFRPGTPQLTNDPSGPHSIPLNTFDVGEGYFDPKDGVIYDYEGVPLRVADEEEKEWITRHCRVGGRTKIHTGIWMDAI